LWRSGQRAASSTPSLRLSSENRRLQTRVGELAAQVEQLRRAVLGLLGTHAERSGGTFGVDVHDVLGDQDHAVGLLRVSGQREGREVNVPVVHVFHVRDGKLAELWIHPLDQYAIDEFWA
jgi:ketosteroid isomerase-like protein